MRKQQGNVKEVRLLKSSSTRSRRLYRLIALSIMGTIALLLMFVSVPLPFLPSYLKIDISDIPALIASVLFSPLAGIIVIGMSKLAIIACVRLPDPIEWPPLLSRSVIEHSTNQNERDTAH